MSYRRYAHLARSTGLQLLEHGSLCQKVILRIGRHRFTSTLRKSCSRPVRTAPFRAAGKFRIPGDRETYQAVLIDGPSIEFEKRKALHSECFLNLCTVNAGSHHDHLTTTLSANQHAALRALPTAQTPRPYAKEYVHGTTASPLSSQRRFRCIEIGSREVKNRPYFFGNSHSTLSAVCNRTASGWSCDLNLTS